MMPAVQRTRFVAIACVLGTLSVGCGGGASLPEYAEQVESLVAQMNGTLDDLDAQLEAAPSLETVKRYAEERVAARVAFVEALDDLDPPSEAAELHEAALGILGRVADAEAALAERVRELDTTVGIDEIWSTPEGVAARSADAEAVALCQSAQAEFDRTELREELGDVPWVPPRMKQIVLVTFGCLAEDR